MGYFNKFRKNLREVEGLIEDIDKAMNHVNLLQEARKIVKNAAVSYLSVDKFKNSIKELPDL